MNDRSTFESRLTDLLFAYAERAPVEVDAVTLAAVISRRNRGTRLSVLGRTWVRPLWLTPVALALLLVGLLAGSALVGAQLLRDPAPAVLEMPSPTVSQSPTPAATSTRAAPLNPAAGYTDLPGWIVFEHFGQAPDGSTQELDFDNRMIWLVHADGSDLHELAPGAPVDGKVSPDISPDGSTVAFSSWSPRSLIWTAPIEGGPPTLVSTDCSGLDDCQEHDPAISADGTRIAFVHYGGGGRPYTEIGIRDLGGGAVTYLENTRISLSGGYVAQPSWSPDGSAIVYHAAEQTESDERVTSMSLFVVSTDGSSLRELPRPDGLWAADPDWSPDGESIVFSSTPNRETEGWSNYPGSEGIWIISPDGTGLTGLNFVGWAPSWTADGSRIMFWGYRSWAMMDADGGNAAHINQPELTWFGEELGYGYAGFLQPTP